MRIGVKNMPLGNKEPTPQQRRDFLDAHEKMYNSTEDNLPDTVKMDGGIAHFSIAEKPSPSAQQKIPKELFNFNIIINEQEFRIVCDTLLSIDREEDLANYSEAKLNECLEKCASYRMTCFCAYISAHKEYRKYRNIHRQWLAEKQNMARNAIRTERLRDMGGKLRKDIGQITKDEIEDWIIVTYGEEYWAQINNMKYWEDNEKIFRELRDTLADRGTHLQTLLKRVSDNIAPKMSNASPLDRGPDIF